MRIHRLYFLLLILIIHSCDQGEIAIEVEPGEILIDQVDLNSDYRYQIYYNLSSSSITSTNIKTNWDLAFENGEDGFHVLLNSSTFSQIAIISNLSFESTVSVPNPVTWRWDSPSGNLDSTAILGYPHHFNVYILDRGIDENGMSRGYKKFMIDTITNTYYKIRYANLDNTETNYIQVDKQSHFSFTQFSFDNNIINQPKKEDWDLLFTQYTHLFLDNITTPSYLVTGVLINSFNNISVAVDSVNIFENINYSMINDYTFLTNMNAIGYNWKEYNFTSQLYEINPNITYIIKDSEDRYFKLQFIDFYNSNGAKGAPKFYLQELKGI